ncbi:MAG: PQQ-binding-like beta-propeller repeat protein [Myxococcota bacterium]
MRSVFAILLACALLTACRERPSPQVVESPDAGASDDDAGPSPEAEDAGPPAVVASPEPEWFDVTPIPERLERVNTELVVKDGEPDFVPQHFPTDYALVDGVLTFRGGPHRAGGAWGHIPRDPVKLELAWQLKTGRSKAPWFGGAGWTGQPAIVRWPAVIRHSMPRLGRFRRDDALVEVIQGSLDGHVYFLDLYTGEKTRKPINTGNPIKGSVSVDPRGYPLLFVGQGIPEKPKLGLHVYELIGHSEVFLLPGRDQDAPRGWGAFDSSGLLNRTTDTYFQPGENGLFYFLKLNTVFDPVALTLSVAPRVTRYRYQQAKQRQFGIENSISVAKNLAFFADNGGNIQALDLRTFQPVWSFDAGDDTDASLALELEDGAPVLYTGCEVDKTGPKGKTHLRKLDGLTGAQRWEVTLPCQGARTPKKIDAGVFATPAVGTGDVADLVYFTLARCPDLESGKLVALDKATGREVWSLDLPHYAWSSPTLVKALDGHSYLLQGDIRGLVRLFDARDGREVARIDLPGEVEASPAVFEDRVVLGARNDTIYGLRIVGAQGGETQ